jgi:hypothetical protein
MTSFGFGQSPESERDMSAVKEFIKTKRSISVRDKGGMLSLSGDVRFEYQSITESQDGAKQRGSGSGAATGDATIPGRANHVFDTEVNLMLDYKADKTWAAVKLEFDNDAGALSGTENSLALQRAVIGYNVLEEDAARVDVEVGRRKLYDFLDSKVQFRSNFDGMKVRYQNSFESVGDFYVTLGAFMVDDLTDHYGWVTEFGLMDVMDSGLYAKYSYIDLDKSGVDRWGMDTTMKRFQSRNSQFTLGYKLQPEVLRTDLTLYGAYLFNHAAKKQTITNNKKKNKAWYLGAKLGKVEYAGDWSFDLNYQSVAAQAVADTEVNGIGRGNVNGDVFATSTVAGTARGNANYKGYAFEGLYAVTDNLTFGMEYESSNAHDKQIGGRNSYHKFEMEVVYGF